MLKTNAKYIDGYVVPVPKKNIAVYRKMAHMGCKMWMRHGALEYFECVGDDLNVKWGMSFPRGIKVKPGETVVFAWIVFKSKAHRDQVNKKVMTDPSMNDPKWKDKPMPFDMKRMIYGGFKVLVNG